MKALKWLGLSLVLGLAITGCSAPAADDAATSPSTSPSPTPIPAPTYPSAETIGVDTWSTLAELDWTPPELAVEGYSESQVTDLGEVLAEWMKASTTDPAMWAATDSPTAAAIVAAALPTKVGEALLAERARSEVTSISQDGWAFGPGSTPNVDESRHTLGWKFEPTSEPNETGTRLAGSLVMRSAWLMEYEGSEPKWLLTSLTHTLSASLPQSINDGTFSFGTTGYLVGATSCGDGDYGGLSSFSDLPEATFVGFTAVPAGEFFTYEDSVAAVAAFRAEAEAEALASPPSTESATPTPTPTPAPAPAVGPTVESDPDCAA